METRNYFNLAISITLIHPWNLQNYFVGTAKSIKIFWEELWIKYCVVVLPSGELSATKLNIQRTAPWDNGNISFIATLWIVVYNARAWSASLKVLFPSPPTPLINYWAPLFLAFPKPSISQFNMAPPKFHVSFERWIILLSLSSWYPIWHIFQTSNLLFSFKQTAGKLLMSLWRGVLLPSKLCLTVLLLQSKF